MYAERCIHQPSTRLTYVTSHTHSLTHSVVLSAWCQSDVPLNSIDLRRRGGKASLPALLAASAHTTIDISFSLVVSSSAALQSLLVALLTGLRSSALQALSPLILNACPPRMPPPQSLPTCVQFPRLVLMRRLQKSLWPLLPCRIVSDEHVLSVQPARQARCSTCSTLSTSRIATPTPTPAPRAAQKAMVSPLTPSYSARTTTNTLSARDIARPRQATLHRKCSARNLRLFCATKLC